MSHPARNKSSEIVHPRGVLKEILRDILGLMLEELSKKEAEIFRQYQAGVSPISIATENKLTTGELRRVLNNIDARLAGCYSKHRLMMLMQMPPLPLSNPQLDEVFIKMGALRMDARIKEIREEHARELADQPVAPSPDLSVLKLMTRSLNVLHTLRATTVEEVCKLTREQILSARNSGQKTVEDIEAALGELGFGLSG